MKVDGFNIYVGIEGVLIEENRTTCVMGHVEAIRENVMANVVRSLLQGNDMPSHRNLFFEGIIFSPTGSRVPVVDAESPIHLSGPSDMGSLNHAGASSTLLWAQAGTTSLARPGASKWSGDYVQNSRGRLL